MKPKTSDPTPEPVAERWAITKLQPACPQCGAPFAVQMPDGDTNWLTDCEPHQVHCNYCNLDAQAYFSVAWPRAVLPDGLGKS